MLFNSYEFILVFLPICLLVFYWLGKTNHERALVWLVLASLFFYGWWNPAYLILIISSMVINFTIGTTLSKNQDPGRQKRKKIILVLGLCFNLGLLGYYKYYGFFIENINYLSGGEITIVDIALPLAISFFTFQQVAYLVDASRGITSEYRFSHYALFVTFFPQLIAGPIVHHKEVLPQFMQSPAIKPIMENIAIGLTIFFIGLFKKAVLADGIAPYANPVFNAAAAGDTLTFFQAWGGALAYTMQLYFDFSGYSDMAIGAARLFGIRLPLNFHSPYKATSIIEFWRRWHMTLSRFLRDYLYIPLGGSRCSKTRRYINLFITMLLGGLWHGAGWTFVVWGGLHGLYLTINHAWHWLNEIIGLKKSFAPKTTQFFAWLLTFTAVVISWVFFRAVDFNSAVAILNGMAGINGVELPNGIMARLGSAASWLQSLGVGTSLGGGVVLIFSYLWIFTLLCIALLMPNTQQIMSNFKPSFSSYQSQRQYAIQCGRVFERFFQWYPTALWSIAIGIIAAFGILALTSVSEFLYFQF